MSNRRLTNHVVDSYQLLITYNRFIVLYFWVFCHCYRQIMIPTEHFRDVFSIVSQCIRILLQNWQECILVNKVSNSSDIDTIDMFTYYLFYDRAVIFTIVLLRLLWKEHTVEYFRPLSPVRLLIAANSELDCRSRSNAWVYVWRWSYVDTRVGP